MNTILHITPRPQWETAKNLGTYRGDTLETEGFIHCSTATQLLGSANRFFQGQKDLVILVIDRDLVQPIVRDEGAEAHHLFPHIYGELNIDAVVQVVDFGAEADGWFVWPAALAS